MEVKNKFEVKEENNKITVIQTIFKEMEMPEAIKELQRLKSEMAQLERQREELKKSIEEDKFNKELNKIIESQAELNKLEEDWNNKIKPAIEELAKKAKMKAKVKKAEMGFDRISDNNDKIVKSNRIMGEVANEMELDVQHPVMMEVRKEFDKL